MTRRYGLTLVTPPTSEPVTIGEVLSHLRLAAGDVDLSEIIRVIAGARDYVQVLTARQVIQATWLMCSDRFPGRGIDDNAPPGWRYGVIRMPLAPLVSVDLLQYIDTNGALQTLANTEYQWTNKSEPGRLGPARLKVWPVTDPYSFDGVQITFTAGYANAAAVPARIRQCVFFMCGHLYEHRESTLEVALQLVPLGLQSFIRASGYGEYV